MQEGRASATAMLTALARARHQMIDHPRVFDDPLAVKIIGPEAVRSLGTGPQDIMSTAGRPAIVARARVTEDELARAVAQGVRQYVVLGAGLDTFAYRNPHRDLQVFEVDHPATQAWKREKLHAAGIAVPANLRFVALDFQKDTLPHALREHGLREDQPAFFSWLGVTMYLPREPMLDTLRYIASRPRGSGVVFDALYRPPLWDIPTRMLLKALGGRYARMGEPWIGFVEPDALEQDMRAMGFSEVRHLRRRQTNQQLFAGRSDGLRIRGERMGGIFVGRV